MPIANVTLENTATTTQTNVPFTFGQVFAQGDLPADSFVCLTAPDGVVIPCQLDVKRKHSDGSVRHASLSVVIPSMSATSSKVYSITSTATGPTGAPPIPADFPGLNAAFTFTDYGTDVGGPNIGTVYTADAADRLQSGTYKTWRTGPICSEWIVRVPLLDAAGNRHPDLHVRFEILAYKGLGKARVHCIVENTWAKPKAVPSGTTPWETVSVSPVIYGYTLKLGGTVVDTRAIKGYHRIRLNVGNTFNGTATGIANDATVYTATVTIDGVAKSISLTGSSIQTYSQLYAAITTQLGGMGTCTIDEGNLGLRITSNTTGAGSSVVIADGTLFPALKKVSAWRPIYGREYIHYPTTRWKKTFWWGAEPQTHIRHDKVYLMATRAIPNYDPALTGSTAKIDARWNELTARGDIGQNGIQKENMPGPGGAPGIGLLPEWVAMYIVNQGKKAKDTMLKQADLMGSWGCHVREYDTDEPISIAKWPYATFSPNAGDSRNPATGLNEKLPSGVTPASLPSNAHTADVAHHPDFNFIPYMVTGDYCYMEGMLFYYAFTCLNLNAHATYRDGARCLWKADSQTRSKSWSIRTAVHSHYLVPDSNQKKSEIAYVISQNVASLKGIYVDPTGSQYNMFGILTELIYNVGGVANVGKASFQEEFATQACGRAVELGYTEFMPLLNFKSKHVAGRLTSGAEFCWQAAATYALRYRDSATSPLYTSWGEVYQKTMAPAVLAATCGSPEMGAAIGFGVNSMGGYPDGTEGYPANMQPAVAYCATFNTPKGDDAWLVFMGRTIKADYNTGPQFAIVPREIAEEPMRVQLYRAGADGLGGEISTTVSDSSFFDDVLPAEQGVGSVEYRYDYVKNEHSSKTLYGAVLWLSSNTSNVGTSIEVGLDPSGINGVAQALPNESTAPAGVTFAAASSATEGVQLGDLPPGATRAVCYRRTIAAGAPATKASTFTRTIEGKIE